LKIEEINRAIKKKKALWVAKDHPFLQLSEKQLRRRTGVIVDKKDLERLRSQPKPDLAAIIAGLEQIKRRMPREKRVTYIKAKRLLRTQHTLEEAILDLTPHIFPQWWLWWLSRDWRNVGGRNCVTPIRDQGDCGSCTAFAIIATLESMLLIERNIETDLSEAELQFCGHGDCSGWWPYEAINYLKNNGVAHESCFPYQDHTLPCVTCSLRDGEAITVTTDVTIFDVQQRKDYLWNIGPMIAVFEIYPDFWGYSSGVYTPTVDPYPDGGPLHAVEVIGYNLLQNAWICKNSWASSWGNNGFFRIAFGQCDIDTTYPFKGISNTKWWQ
jgi:hypothetical protein